MDHDDTVAKLTAAWDVRGIDLATLAFRDGTAVAPHDHEAVDPARMHTLPTLLAPGPAGAKPQFELREVLGEGGMGVVLAAHQVALAREVAVKRPKAELGRAPQLLREGRVTGVLEHPNVVPVYALGRDNDDRPLLVMKRIEGVAWSALIQSDERGDGDAYLRKHLAILAQVARAIHFAHSRGIIHRDLKPDNVMVGGFGEVYVVDWGIAVASGKQSLEGVPLAASVQTIEGTPAYMAPEMAAGDGDSIDERSDVFLLGAMLHEILTGVPPHDGASLIAVLTAAFTCPPKTFDAWVPRDLAAICNKAMARERDDRYPTAAAFAEAIDEFLVHRASTQLSDEAEIQLAELRRLCALPPDERDAERMYATFSPCRFAFQQALRSWSGNAAAEAGLQEALERMIGFELDRGTPQAALTLLHDLPRDNPELAARVSEAADKKRLDEERLARLARETDMTLGQALRRVMILLVASLYGVGCIGCGLLNRYGIFEVGHNTFALFNLGVASFIALAVKLRHETLLANLVGRRLAFTAMLIFAAYASIWALSGHLGMSMAGTAALHSLLGLGMWTLATLNVEKRWVYISIGSVLSLTAVLLDPVHFFEWMGVFGAAGSLTSAARYMKAYES